MTLIAKVRVAAMVGSERQEFAPGDPLPKLHPHDEAQLLASDSIEDVAEVAAADKRDAKEAIRSMGAFEAERKAVQAAVASSAPPEAAPTKKSAK